ncbi:uncharacterized protein LOC133838342 [Drosophila sulfurigaster albostrigata]|uniref:uncharacterized protein LOC133838342 n=1 Tax=Drosophila sulfurigaster albostrigata TaxID=89887 RepID=UPI002D21838A|nr:uncharacterized protein LOC133838342 [Drosophila sulfurigaster albostrigata]
MMSRCTSIAWNWFRRLRSLSPSKATYIYIYASKRGIVRLRNDHEITLEDVLFSEQAAGNLMSVKRLQEAGMSIKFDKNGITIFKNGLTVVKNPGPIVGYIRDRTQDYILVFHILNVFMALCAFPWVIEVLIIKFRRRSKLAPQ